MSLRHTITKVVLCSPLKNFLSANILMLSFDFVPQKKNKRFNMSLVKNRRSKTIIEDVEIIEIPSSLISPSTPKKIKLNHSQSSLSRTQPIILNSMINLKDKKTTNVRNPEINSHVSVGAAIDDFFLKNENNCFYKCVLCSETIKSKPTYKSHIQTTHGTNANKFHLQKGFIDATTEFCTEFTQSDFNIVQSLTTIFDQIENIERIIRDHKKRLAENDDDEMMTSFLKDEVSVLKIYGEMIQRAFDIVSEKNELVTSLQVDVRDLLEHQNRIHTIEIKSVEEEVVKEEDEPMYELYYIEDDEKECNEESSDVPVETSGATTKRGRPKGELARTLDDSLAELPEETAEYIRSLTANGESKYPCNMCEVSSKTKMLLCLHHSRVHLKRKTKICPHCDRAFASQGDLTRHVRIHSGENPFKCLYGDCTSEFKTSGDLKKHKMVHERDPSDRPHKCTECESKFARLTDLTRHKKIHLIGKNESVGFRCEICKKIFYRKDLYRTHVNRHLQIKPFECELCQKRFAKKYDLLRHLEMQHKNVNCDDCGETFNRKKLENHFSKGCSRKSAAAIE
ncbi:Zinc finger protein [Pseudolycoriella hygida]|uniref:Zinc finger protein n=1 Tax=Pseudolycoriella hygida TaxID=35572 RepID=A0A9Q0RV45_9DIPT|nr:Zinc finger protein [Pseudolycoriella hygida]